MYTEANSFLVVILIPILVAVIFNDLSNRRLRKEIRADLLQGREPMPFPVLFETHFARYGASQDNLCELWTEVAIILEVDPTLLRPEDRLVPFNAHYFNHNIFDSLEYLIQVEFPKEIWKGN